MATKNDGKMILGKVTSRLSRYPVGPKIVEIALSRTVSEINAFWCFTQKFKMAAKNGGKTFWEKFSADSADPCWLKILQELLYLAPFPR